MSKQPVVNARDIHRLLNHFGNYALKKNSGGSRKHLKFVKTDGSGKPIIIPSHSDEAIRKGTLKQIIEAIAENEGVCVEYVLSLLN